MTEKEYPRPEGDLPVGRRTLYRLIEEGSAFASEGIGHVAETCPAVDRAPPLPLILFN